MQALRTELSLINRPTLEPNPYPAGGVVPKEGVAAFTLCMPEKLMVAANMRLEQRGCRDNIKVVLKLVQFT
jgi:hypothetical protein